LFKFNNYRKGISEKELHQTNWVQMRKLTKDFAIRSPFAKQHATQIITQQAILTA